MKQSSRVDELNYGRGSHVLVTIVRPHYLNERAARYRESGSDLEYSDQPAGAHEAYLKALYDDPGFAPIRANQEAHQARERKRFLTIVCTDNPYAAVWRPEKGTCERFATAGAN